MAGLRQGLALAAPRRPQRSGGRCRPTFLGFREERAFAQGKKLRANRCSKGARGAAVACQPKPLARTWMSAVPDSQTPRRFGKDGSARSMSGDWFGVNAVMRLLKQAAHLPDASIDKILRRAGCLRVSLILEDWLRSLRKPPLVRWAGKFAHRRFLPACSRVNVANAENAQGTVAVKRQLPKAPTPRPVLPGGAFRCCSAAP
jgi:hypothetical protein